MNNSDLLKSLLPGLISLAAGGCLAVGGGHSYIRIVDQRDAFYGDAYLVDCRGRQLSRETEKESPQVNISTRAVEKLRERCANPGENESPFMPAIGHIWLPVDRSVVGFCVVPLEAYNPEAKHFGRGKALNITSSGGYYLNTNCLDGFMDGTYPCLVAGKVSIDSFLAN